MGPTFVTFLFQLSFATTATTIVSGAMAERCNFNAYCLFSLVNTVVYCLPAHWMWSPSGNKNSSKKNNSKTLLVLTDARKLFSRNGESSFCD